MPVYSWIFQSKNSSKLMHIKASPASVLVRAGEDYFLTSPTQENINTF